jgi:predicted alpha/beta superfamily hydrolase
MKTFCFITIIALFLLLCTYGIQAQITQIQNQKNCLDNTEQFSLTSKYVEGETYVIQVSLPIGYSSSQQFYPVLYVLDGDVFFGMAKEIAMWLMFNEEIKDIIVIGISYGQGTDAWYSKRVRDLMPSSNTFFAKNQKAGEADNFLKFIQYELLPTVNKNYRTYPDSSAISGISLGGLLNTYILFKQPELFKNYIIISPALNWRKESTFKCETEYFSNHRELNKTVYMAYASMDNKKWIINPTNEIIQTIQTRNYAGLKFVSQVLEGETHHTVYPVAITHGLKTVFKR